MISFCDMTCWSASCKEVLCNLNYQIQTPYRFFSTALSKLGHRKLANFLYLSIKQPRWHLSLGRGICWKRQQWPDAKQRGKWILPAIDFLPLLFPSLQGLESAGTRSKPQHSQNRQKEKSPDTDGPAQTYSVGKVLEWWHPGMLKTDPVPLTVSPYSDFPSLVFSKHELVRKRGTHKHRWSMKAKHCQRLLSLWPNANLTLCSTS